MLVNDPKFKRRHFLLGSAALPVGMLVPDPALAAPRRMVSEFGRDETGLQEAFDWAHNNKGELVLDANVTIRGTVFMGSVSLVDGGGRIEILGDSLFEIRNGSGAWSKRAAILMRSARGNSHFSDALETAYDVYIGPNVRISFLRTDKAAPEGPILFNGLSYRSRINMDFAGESTGDLTCNGPDFYFFNRAVIAGSYHLKLETRSAEGGFWFRDIDELGMGPNFRSDFLFARPVFSKSGGADECVAIYTVRREPGHLRARGSLEISQSNGLGFSILNNSGASDTDFEIALMEVKVRSTTKRGQPVVKIRDSAPLIDRVEAVFEGAEVPGEAAFVMRCIRESTDGKYPQIGTVKLVNQSRQSRAPVALEGACEIGKMEKIGL